MHACMHEMYSTRELHACIHEMYSTREIYACMHEMYSTRESRGACSWTSSGHFVIRVHNGMEELCSESKLRTARINLTTMWQ